jgi:hypothetical protein
LTVSSPAVFDEDEELFLTQTEVDAYDPSGPTLRDIEVPVALQGRRHGLRYVQYEAARKAFRGIH